MTLKCDYAQKHVDVSMPGYITCALARFKVCLPTQPQYSPHVCAPIHYGAHTQLTDPEDTTTPLNVAGIREVQEIVGVLLYYTRAVNSSILVTLNTIGSQQSQETERTADVCI